MTRIIEGSFRQIVTFCIQKQQWDCGLGLKGVEDISISNIMLSPSNPYISEVYVQQNPLRVQ